jgi:hypothetical protein
MRWFGVCGAGCCVGFLKSFCAARRVGWLCCVVRAFGRSEKSFVLAVLLYLALDWRDLSAIARDDKAYLARVG